MARTPPTALHAERNEFDRLDMGTDSVTVHLVRYRYTGDTVHDGSVRDRVATTSRVAVDVRRHCTGAAEPGGLTPADARTLARMLVAAADAAESEQRRSDAAAESGAPPPRRTAP